MATKKEQAARTRALIIDSAIKLFARQGFAPTSTQDLAKAIRMTTGTLYWHFKDKEDLLIAVLAELEGRLTASLTAPGEGPMPEDVIGTMEALIARVAATVEKHQENFLVVGVIGAEATDTNPRVEKALRSAYGQFAGVAFALLEQAKKEKLVAPEFDSACASQMFIGMYMGAVLHQRLYRAEFPLPRALPVVQQMLLASLVGKPVSAAKRSKERRTGS
jgi:AcrR family transcriptional regulator